MNTAMTIKKILEDKKAFDVTVREGEKYTTISVKPRSRPVNDLQKRRNPNNFSPE